MHNAYGWAASSFVFTVISAQWWSVLPTLPQLAALSLFFVGVWLLPQRQASRWTPVLSGCILGAIWMASVGHSYMSWQLPRDKIKQNVMIEGYVESVKFEQPMQKLTLQLTRLDENDTFGRVSLHWFYPTQRYLPGQKIRVCARLKPARGLQNPGGFDYWRWLVSESIVATGYISDCEENKLLAIAQSINQTLKFRIGNMETLGEKWLLAILLADRSALSQDDWVVLQRTGVAHLFTLSGLHMGIVFVLCLWSAKVILFFIAKLSPQWFPHGHVSQTYLLALFFAWCFVLLCQSPIPLVRAAVAISLFVALRLSNRFISVGYGLCLILAICLLIFPLSIMGLSLYLSFFAVCCVMFLLWRFYPSSDSVFAKFKHVIMLQLMLSVFMTLATGSAFNAIHWSSFIINLFAIPFVSFLIVPVGCLGLIMTMLYPLAGTAILRGLGDILHAFMSLLADAPTSSTPVNLPFFIWGVLGLCLFLMYVPKIRYKGPIVLIAGVFVSVLLTSAGGSSSSHWTFHVFDVGQGSALLIESEGEAMLVDTGAHHPDASSMAEQVVIPVLEHFNLIGQVTGVVTHFDNDHAGGQNWLKQYDWITDWRSPDSGCEQGASWQVGKVTVRALWPPNDRSQLSENNGSCVILISDGYTRVLIPGDIEHEAEKAIVERYHNGQGIGLDADILVAPHHGSKTSSSLPWVHSTSPSHVVFTVGAFNRWGFPHQRVEKRYQAIGANTYSTSEHGYLRFTIPLNGSGKGDLQVESMRYDIAPRWYKSR